MKETTDPEDGGAEGSRTPDPHNAIVVLYQLSYDPIQSGRKLRTGPLYCQKRNPLKLRALGVHLKTASGRAFAMNISSE